MSRLIFEGDTTKRFGEKFPRPFIEEVRAYDNGVEVDIAFYFKVPNDDDSVVAFLSSLKDLSQTIVLSAITEKTLNTLKSNKDFNAPSEAFMQQGSNLEDTTFARRRMISISDFINGNSTPPPSPEQAPRDIAEYLGVVSGDGSRMNAGAGVRINAAAGVDMGTIAAPGTTIEENAATEYSSYNVAIKDDFYNQEGTRFMKIFGTLPIDYNASDEMYITCFVKND